MTPALRRWLSGALGIGLVLVLIGIVLLDDRFTADPPATFEIREVQVYEDPPPPPPPPVERSTEGRAGPAISQVRNAEAIVLERMELDVKLALGEPGDFGLGGWGIGEGAGQGIDPVAFADLDKAPVILGSPPIVYPDEAIEQGVYEFTVVVHILVDEQGRTYPIKILSNPFPSFELDVINFVSNVTFTPPTRLGVPVRTEYSWPLLIKK